MMVCPQCHRELPPELPVTGRRRQALVDCLRKYPNGRTIWQVMDYIYRDDAGGGPSGHSHVSKMVLAINRQLSKHGWKITATGGPGSTYHLKRL